MSPSRAGALTLIGGELALDFANTRSARGLPAERDHLQRPEHVVQWAAHAQVLAPEEAQWLAEAAAANPVLGQRLIAQALALREDVYELGAAIAAGGPAPRQPLAGLAHAYAHALARAALAPIGVHFGWTWRPREAPVETILGPISLSALTLLQQADLTRVKQCQGEKCGWLFFDATKNKSRRWCEMEVCGNRAKQKRFARTHPG
ncbi:MAG TPA: CGNR zinc finger domain-containing protein [Roseiarcus sp.]|nr:CGNR zinc finger domain-containing protein [Roseiarcus sp.]